MSPDINIVLFNEASLRLYHELSRHDIIYIDATGNLFANEKKHKRLLYYAMVLRNPFAHNSPVPIVEYITSRHTTDSIGLMIRKLKEREKEVFKNAVTPVLVISDFGMAIINACLREFNNKSLEEYFERGYRIVTGKAAQEEVQKTIHHVCSAHMMQIIKKHAKNLCEKGHPAESQIHIAMRFFGRLLCATSLRDMKDLVDLSYVIFKSKYVSNTLTEKLDRFSETLHKFVPQTEIEQESDSANEEDGERTEISEGVIDNVVIGPCTIKQFWEEQLKEIEKINPLNESVGESNKYYMPAFFDYIAKNYLPSCLLWSNLLLGNLSRHNVDYSPTLSSGTHSRNYLTDNQTNGEIEVFFKMKKNCSFKGQSHLRIDTFIGENWKDNLALQRQFIDGIIKQDTKIRQPTLRKLKTLCSVNKFSDSTDFDFSSASNTSDDQAIEEMELEDEVLPTTEEQWQKPNPRRSSRKKGKYLNATNKKLKFSPVVPKKNEQNVKHVNTSSFEEYERLVWNDVSS